MSSNKFWLETIEKTAMSDKTLDKSKNMSKIASQGVESSAFEMLCVIAISWCIQESTILNLD